jgi:hypothetical protein
MFKPSLRFVSALSLCLGVGVLACSSGGASSSGSLPTEDDGGASNPGPFDLAVTVGTTKTTRLAIAVRDAETKELVAFARKEAQDLADITVTITKPGLLLLGHRYEVGVKAGSFADCAPASQDIWYRAIPEVNGNVSIDASVAYGVEADARGCDVIHEPVKLPPGTYATTAPVLGVAGNNVTMVVSPSGRVYPSVRIFCSNPDCLPTKISDAACADAVIYPGEDTFSTGSSGSYTSVRGTATIDAVAKTVRYIGRTKTILPSSGRVCCDEPFDVVLKQASTDAGKCP